MSPGGSRTPVYKCALCPKKYSKREHLQRHERTHTGARPFRCPICERAFTRGDVLSRHLKVHDAARSPSRQNTSLNGTNGANVPSENVPPALGQDIARLSQEQPPAGANLHARVTSTSSSHELSSQTRTYPLPSPPLQPLGTPDPPNGSSSLLWPDSEKFLQALQSWDPLSWERCSTGPQLNASSNFRGLNPSQGESIGGPQDGPVCEDGDQALHAVNGLVRDTLATVTASTDLAELTPRFLDSTLHMFFMYFIRMLPVIHRPTFTFGASVPLLLNAFALGSLFLGTEDSIKKGEALWRLAHTSIATSWPSMIRDQGEYDACPGIQLVLSALLSQVYAAFSRNQTLRKTSQTFSGLSMHWAQYCGMLNFSRNTHVPSLDDSADEKMRAWKSWVAREIQLRALLGIGFIDGVASQFNGNPSTTWLTINALPLPADDESFLANTPDKWVRVMLKRAPSDRDATRFCDLCHSLLSGTSILGGIPIQLELLDARTILEILNSMAMQSSRSSSVAIGYTSRSNITEALAQLRYNILSSQRLTPTDRLIVLMRWHAVCLETLASSSRGARRMCYEYGVPQHIFGGEWREESGIEPTRWVNSPGGRKSLLHAREILILVSQIPLGLAHDVYLAGAVFSAATTYASFALCGVSRISIPCFTDWGTVLLGRQSREEATDEKHQNTTTLLDGRFDELKGDIEDHNLVYGLVAFRILLRGLSLQWGVMLEMEKAVGEWVGRCG